MAISRLTFSLGGGTQRTDWHVTRSRIIAAMLAQLRPLNRAAIQGTRHAGYLTRIEYRSGNGTATVHPLEPGRPMVPHSAYSGAPRIGGE